MIRIILFFALLSAGVLLIRIGVPEAGKDGWHLAAWLCGFGFVLGALAVAHS